MTTLIAWSGVDQRGPSSLYFASDSRITWGSHARRWEVGPKIFTSKNSPDIFGYVGEVLFPSLVLGQIIDCADEGLLGNFWGNAVDRNAAVETAIRTSLDHQSQFPQNDFEILHASRDDYGENCKYYIWRLSYSASNRGLKNEPILFSTNRSGLIVARGSGADTFNICECNLAITDQGRTSRSIFWAFCDALKSKSDPLTGGAPQLAGIYNKWNAKAFGLLFDGRYYFHGFPLCSDLRPNSIEWRDELFQRIDSATGKKIASAQVHARSKTGSAINSQ